MNPFKLHGYMTEKDVRSVMTYFLVICVKYLYLCDLTILRLPWLHYGISGL